MCQLNFDCRRETQRQARIKKNDHTLDILEIKPDGCVILWIHCVLTGRRLKQKSTERTALRGPFAMTPVRVTVVATREAPIPIPALGIGTKSSIDTNHKHHVSVLIAGLRTVLVLVEYMALPRHGYQS